jgi:tRNA threonylcarbamoyladenosine biosynthesis protein TsaE
MEIITKSAQETYEFGQKIGSGLKGGEILALVGDLGSGKTTFMQGLGKSLGVARIISPTFILMRTYNASDKVLYHLDLYRIEKNADQELKNIGASDAWGKPDTIVIVEWADRARDAFPSSTQWITFETMSETERKITTNG